MIPCSPEVAPGITVQRNDTKGIHHPGMVSSKSPCRFGNTTVHLGESTDRWDDQGGSQTANDRTSNCGNNFWNRRHVLTLNIWAPRNKNELITVMGTSPGDIIASESIATISKLEVRDEKGQTVTFGSLFEDQKTVIIFIRMCFYRRRTSLLSAFLAGHFFCGVRKNSFTLTASELSDAYGR